MRALIGIPNIDSESVAFVATAPEGMSTSDALKAVDNLIVKLKKNSESPSIQGELEEALEGAGFGVWPYQAASHGI